MLGKSYYRSGKALRMPRSGWWEPLQCCLLLGCSSLIAAPAWAQEPTWRASELQVVLRGERESELAPHRDGNIYAPEVHRFKGEWWMWYGGQGADGHDRIHLAKSKDGRRWQKLGVVIDCGTFNHVNDPAVVRVGDRWWMFYTVAPQAEMDEIAAATSRDGVSWELLGTVLSPGDGAAWDSLKVGRPAVLHNGSVFQLWYDGQPTPQAAEQNSLARSIRSEGRGVGYAESADGLNWKRHEQPVFRHGAGAVHIVRQHTVQQHVAQLRTGKKVGSSVGNDAAQGDAAQGDELLSADQYWMVYESGKGVLWASSSNGTDWESQGFLVRSSGDGVDRFGCVTPQLVIDNDMPQKKIHLFFGAAARQTWDGNAIAVIELQPGG